MSPGRGSVQATLNCSKKYSTKASAPASVCFVAAAGMSGPLGVVLGEGEADGDSLADALGVASGVGVWAAGEPSDALQPATTTAPSTPTTPRRNR